MNAPFDAVAQQLLDALLLPVIEPGDKVREGQAAERRPGRGRRTSRAAPICSRPVPALARPRH